MQAKARALLSWAFASGGPPAAVTLLLVAAANAAWLLHTGVVMAPDSYSYDHFAGRSIDTGFDFAAVYNEADSQFPPILYALFVLLVALLKLPFAMGWPVALVILNFIASLLLGLMLVRLARRVTNGGAAAWAALILYLLCFDLKQWVPFALSDPTFCLLAFTIFTLAAERILEPARRWAGVLALAAVGVFYRPTGLVLLPDLAWAAYLSRRRRPLPPRRLVLSLLIGAIALGALLFALIMQEPARWPFTTLAPAFESVAQSYSNGQIVSARRATYHAPPAELTDYLLVSGDRFLHFFAPGVTGFSLAHWLVELAFFIPCYALALWLLVALWRRETRFGAAEQKVFLAAAGAILAYAVFHGLIQVDYDWRYRLPVLPHMILLAAGGMADLARRYAR